MEWPAAYLALVLSLIQPEGWLPAAPDLPILGLALAILGCFLLANSIVFRHPRVLVSEFFGAQEKRLTTIRSYIFHRVQIHLGFLFLLLGFGLQLLGLALGLVGLFFSRFNPGTLFGIHWALWNR